MVSDKMDFIASSSLPEQIAAHIENKIITMEYKPGERLVERKIAEDLGLSQSPVREALRILEKIKLVRLVPRHGSYVTELTEEFIVSAYNIFKELVALATGNTVERRTEDDILKINNALNTVKEYTENNDMYKFNEAFFEWGITCLRAAYDPLLEEMLLDLVPSMRRFQYITFLYKNSNDMAETLEKTTFSVKCIESGNVHEAVENNRNYIEKSKQTLLKIFRENKI